MAKVTTKTGKSSQVSKTTPTRTAKTRPLQTSRTNVKTKKTSRRFI